MNYSVFSIIGARPGLRKHHNNRERMSVQMTSHTQTFFDEVQKIAAMLDYATIETLANELAADRMGAELACRAGFDPAAGASLFRHLRPSRVHPKAGVRRAAVLAVGCGDASSPTDQPAKAPIAAIISGRASRLGSDPSQLAAAARMASNQESNRPGSISWKSTGFSTPTGSQ